MRQTEISRPRHLSQETSLYLIHQRMIAQALLGLPFNEHQTPEEINSLSQAFLGLPILTDHFPQKAQEYLKTRPSTKLQPNHYPEDSDLTKVLTNISREIEADPRNKDNQVDLSTLGLYWLTVVCFPKQKPETLEATLSPDFQPTPPSLPEDLESQLPPLKPDTLQFLKESLGRFYIAVQQPNLPKDLEKLLSDINLLGLYFLFPLSYEDIAKIDVLIKKREPLSRQKIGQIINKTLRSLKKYIPQKKQEKLIEIGREERTKKALFKYLIESSNRPLNQIMKALLVYGVSLNKIREIFGEKSFLSLKTTLQRMRVLRLFLPENHLKAKEIGQKLEKADKDRKKTQQIVNQINRIQTYRYLRKKGIIISIQTLLKNIGYRRNNLAVIEIFNLLQKSNIPCGYVNDPQGRRYYFIPSSYCQQAAHLINQYSSGLNLSKRERNF